MIPIVVLPNPNLCPNGKIIDIKFGQTVCDALLQNNIKIEHACEKSGVCATCHIIIRKGFNLFKSSSDNEDDLINKAWGSEIYSRLSCRTTLSKNIANIKIGDITIEIPKYTVNYN